MVMSNDCDTSEWIVSILDWIHSGPQYLPPNDPLMATSFYGCTIVSREGPVSLIRWFAATLLFIGWLFISVYHWRSLSNSRHSPLFPRIFLPERGLFFLLTIATFFSCFHNIDNILRPALYFTPKTIYFGILFFAMDIGVPFWFCGAIAGTIVVRQRMKRHLFINDGGDHSQRTIFEIILNYFIVLCSTLLIGNGFVHYQIEPFSSFSLFANFTILAEVVFSIIFTAFALLSDFFYYKTFSTNGQQIVSNARYQGVPTADSNDDDEHQQIPCRRRRVSPNTKAAPPSAVDQQISDVHTHVQCAVRS